MEALGFNVLCTLTIKLCWALWEMKKSDIFNLNLQGPSSLIEEVD